MKLGTLIVLSLIFLLGCRMEGNDDYRYVKQHKTGAVHLYLDFNDTGSSLVGTIKKDTLKVLEPYSKSNTNSHLWVPSTYIQGHIILVDPYWGLTVYKRINGDKGYSIKVIGAYDVDSIEPQHILVKSSLGNAVINLSNTSAPVAESFVFSYLGYGPPIVKKIVDELTQGQWCSSGTCKKVYYFQCPTSSDRVIYGWKTGELKTDPICYAYTN